MEAAKFGHDFGDATKWRLRCSNCMAQDGSQKKSDIRTPLPKVETLRELVFDRLKKIDRFNMVAPGVFGNEKTPEWVLKVMLQVGKVYLPGVKITKETRNTPLPRLGNQ
jgi:hypothetical protein